MKAKPRKIIWILLAFMIAVLPPHLLLAKGGVYTSTKHGDPKIGVYRTGSEPRGSCSQCHYQHASYGGSRTGGPYKYALFTDNANNLCYTCHNTPRTLNVYQGSTIYNQSSHATSSSVVWPGPTPPARPTGDWGKCVNCHNPHGYKDSTGLIPNMAFSREENLCLPCHDGSPASKNINAQYIKTYKHPTASYSGKHSTSENGTPANFASPNNRHAECEDCHNPHYAKRDSAAPLPPNASNRIVGVNRVKVINGPAGIAPTYNYRAPNDTSFFYEYEICFKCHSSWTTQPAGQSDMALLFNGNNPSYHPVEAQGKNRNINSNAFVNNWTWDKLTYCTDCHTSDDTTVRGPHGSANRYLLKKSYAASPTSRTMSSNEMCFDCHRYDTYTNNSASNTIKGYSRFNPPNITQGHTYHVGNKMYSCYTCHQSHGSTNQPALIATGRVSTPKINGYTQTSTGGTCSPTCHGSKSYTINYAR